MSKHYGVKCHSCGNPIVLANLDSSLSIVELASFAVPSEPIECPYLDCGDIDIYVPSDGYYFQLGDVGGRRSIRSGVRLNEFLVN
jgi:hypothetical protein